MKGLATSLSLPQQSARLFVFLFSVTLFLSAALMFTVQPMIGKMMLPMIGGAPSGWLVTMAFFQVVLLVGYCLAHFLSRLSPRLHVLVVSGVLFSGFFVQPLKLNFELLNFTHLPESFNVAFMLAAELFLPVLALSMMSPSLQRLFGSGEAEYQKNPYFLFAASNLGSFGGLLLYPLWIERAWGLNLQANLWLWGYGALFVLCLLCLVVSSKNNGAVKVPVKLFGTSGVTLAERMRWVLLAFIPSSLMMGLTARVTVDTGSAPLFWVLPLALYLLTFVQAFKDDQTPQINHLKWLQPLSIAFLMLPFGGKFGPWYLMCVGVVVFYFTARLCHTILAQRRPDKENLTGFYLWVAVGGALGGLFNIFAAPFIFATPIEFALVAWGSLFIHLLLPKKGPGLSYTWLVGSCVFAFVSVLLARFTEAGSLQVLSPHVQFVLIAALTILSFRPWLLAGVVFFLCLILGQADNGQKVVETRRNFFGVSIVTDNLVKDMTVRRMIHGSTLHGQQKLKPEIDTTPHSYYEGALGDLINRYQPTKVGMIGLGAGTVVCYQAPNRQFTVYEIDPDVIALASKDFDYFRVCGTPVLKVGDGRKLLEKDQDARYDLFIIDAFSSDSIPSHLLTREAFKLYFERLTPNGVLAIHITNNFYDLRYPLSDIVSELGLAALTKGFKPDMNSHPLTTPSDWAVIARDPAQIEALRTQGWKDLPASSGSVWTDDFTDTLSALRFTKVRAMIDKIAAHLDLVEK